MIGAWFPTSEWVVISFVRFVAIFLIVYFLAIVIYWFNRTGEILSLRSAFRMMIQLTRWFPKILFHRVRIFPARLRRKKVDAYPALNNTPKPLPTLSKKTVSNKNKRKNLKSTERKK